MFYGIIYKIPCKMKGCVVIMVLFDGADKSISKAIRVELDKEGALLVSYGHGAAQTSINLESLDPRKHRHFNDVEKTIVSMIGEECRRRRVDFSPDGGREYENDAYRKVLTYAHRNCYRYVGGCGTFKWNDIAPYRGMTAEG